MVLMRSTKEKQVPVIEHYVHAGTMVSYGQLQFFRLYAD